MSSFNKIPTEKKLAGVITGFVSLSFLTILFLYKIAIPLHAEFAKPLSGTMEVSYIHEMETETYEDQQNGKSLSSSLPSGITKSIVNIENELFRNSFVTSLEKTNKNTSENTSSVETGTPGKSPDQSIGKGKEIQNPTSVSRMIGGDLSNRKLLTIKKVTDSNEEGIVVVRVTVSPGGETTEAEIDPARTSTTSYSLRSKAQESALTAFFEPVSLSESQTGFITFKFEF